MKGKFVVTVIGGDKTGIVASVSTKLRDMNINIIQNLLKENKYAMFLRKVDREFPDESILQLMEYDAGHKYDTVFNKAIKKRPYKITTFFIGILLLVCVIIIKKLN